MKLLLCRSLAKSITRLFARLNLLPKHIRPWGGMDSGLARIVLAALFAGCPLYGATFTVTRTNISGPGSLPVIINQANATPGDNVIEFAVTGTISLAAPLPRITNNLTINGPVDQSVTISGCGANPIFYFEARTTNMLSRLNVVNGKSGIYWDGAAIRSYGTLFLNNCAFTNNLAQNGNGGAVYSLGNLTVLNCNFANCSGLAGGAIACSSNLTISTTGFFANRASGGAGGAVFCGGASAIDLLASSFEENSTSMDGGAIYVSAGTIRIADCAFIHNVANTNGGAVFNRGSCTMSNSFVCQNSAAEGGGIYNYTAQQLYLSGLNISSNSARCGFGGGLCNRGSLVMSASILVANYCVGKDYTTRGQDGMGGGLFHSSGYSSGITNCTISGNSVVGGRGQNLRGAAYGAGICVTNGYLKLVNCTVTSNTAGEGLSVGSGGGIHSGKTVVLLNTIIAGNSVIGDWNSGRDLWGAFNSTGFNLIGDNRGATGLSINDYQNEPANLGLLQDNGGPTWTHALLPGSLAIGGGTSDGAPPTDQRGVLRPPGRCDIGAFQFVTLIEPTITWPNPAPIIWGTALSATQLNASASAPGTLAYSPPAGTTLPVGSNQLLTVVLTPADPSQYTGATNQVRLDVLKRDQTITFNSIPDQPMGGAPLVLSASTSSGLPVTFSLLSGAATLTGNLLSLGSTPGLVTVRAAQPGNTNFNAAAEVERSFYLGQLPLPRITLQPAHQAVYPGERVTLLVAATHGPLAYQWQLAGVDVAGANTPQLILGRVKTSQVGPYRVIVSNSSGSVTSAVAQVTVMVSPGTPAIVSAPQSQIIRTHERVSLSVAATGEAPLVYQWHQGESGLTNGLIAGATSPTFVTSALTANASFWVSVHNMLGAVDSGTALITVYPAQAARLTCGRLSGFSTLTIDGLVGATYRIDGSTNLNPATWTPVISLTLPANPYTFIDSGSISVPTRFYRVVAP